MATVRMPIPSGMEAQARALFTGVSTRVFVQFPFGNAGGYVNWDGAWTGFNGDYGHVYSGWSGWKTTGSWALDWNITGYAFMNYGFDAEAVEYRLKQQGAAYMWTPFRFPGQYYDAETDTSANWHRFYDAFTGRFRGPDLLLQVPEYSQVMSLQGSSARPYAYAGNNPLSVTDPSGLMGEGETADAYNFLRDNPQIWPVALAVVELAPWVALTQSSHGPTFAEMAVDDGSETIRHMDEHISLVLDASPTENPDPNDPNNRKYRDLNHRKGEIKGAIKNLQKILKRLPKNRLKRAPVEEAIKRGQEALRQWGENCP